MAGESNWVTHVQGAAGSSWVQLRAPYPYQRCAFALKMQPRRDADSPDGAPARERWPVLPVGAFTTARLRCAEVRCERVGGAVDVCRGRPAEMTEAQNLARKPSESSRQNDSVTLLKGA